MRPNGDDLAASSIARWDRERDDFDVFSEPGQREAFARWAGLSEEALEGELGRREAFLRGLLEQETASIPEVNAAIERFYEEAVRRPGG